MIYYEREKDISLLTRIITENLHMLILEIVTGIE